MNSKAITIPYEIIPAGLRTVSARKKQAALFEDITESEDEEMAQSNEGHVYFISALEEVIITLQPCFSSTARASEDKPNAQPPANTIEDLQNRFAALEVEEPTEDSGEAAPSPRVVYEVEPPKSEKEIKREKMFAIFCLFQDFDELQHLIEDMWYEFALGKLDLITASVTTKAAFQVATRMQDELTVLYPDCKYYDCKRRIPYLLFISRTCPGPA